MALLTQEIKLLIIDDSPPNDPIHGDPISCYGFNSAWYTLGFAVEEHGGKARCCCYRTYRDVISSFKPDMIMSDMRDINYFLELIEFLDDEMKLIFHEHVPYWGSILDVQWIEDWSKIRRFLKRINGYAPVTRSEYISPVLQSLNPRCTIFPYWFFAPWPDNIIEMIDNVEERNLIENMGNLAYCGAILKLRGGDRKWAVIASIAAAKAGFTPLVTLIGDYDPRPFKELLSEIAQSEVVIAPGMGKLDFLKNVLAKSEVCISLPYHPPGAALTISDAALLEIPCISTPLEAAYDLFPDLTITGPIVDEIIAKLEHLGDKNSRAYTVKNAKEKVLTHNYDNAYNLLKLLL